MEGELAATAKKAVEAITILGLDDDHDFERGCVSALQVAADSKPLLEKAFFLVPDFPKLALERAKSLIIALDAAITSIAPVSDSKIDPDARSETLKVLEVFLKQARSIEKSTE